VEFEVGLESVEALIADDLVLRFEEVGLAHVQIADFGGMDALEIGGPLEVRIELIEGGEGHDVVAVLGVAEFDARRGAFGERGFDVDDLAGFGLCLVLGLAGEFEDGDDVGAILVANLLHMRIVLDVVVAVREGEATLMNGLDLFRRIDLILFDTEAEEDTGRGF
jgi:hypothetical protein